MLLIIVEGGSSLSGELCTLWLVLGHAGTLSMAAAADEQAHASTVDCSLRLSCSKEAKSS